MRVRETVLWDAGAAGALHRGDVKVASSCGGAGPMNRAALRLILPGRVAGAGGADSAAVWGGGTLAVQRDCGSGKEFVMPSFLPDADGALLTWSINFASRL